MRLGTALTEVMNHTTENERLIDDFLRARAIEEKMLIYLRQGKISKWFSSFGQEALSVAATHALASDEYICTMHRNLGVFVAREVPLLRLFAQFQGKPAGFTKGRDRSFHFGSQEHHIIGMISHLGAQLGLACGLALREKMCGTGKCVLAFTGDGGTSQGDFHEALNVASVWDLPVVFVIERNYWGLSTPEEQQFIFKSFLDKGPAYGMEARSFNANDLQEGSRAFSEAAAFARQEQKPILLEARTFRIRGHEEASGTKYYPQGMIDAAMEEEPMALIQNNLSSWGLTQEELDNKMGQFKSEVDEAFHAAVELDGPRYDAQESHNDLYAPSVDPHWTGEGVQEMRMIDAIHDALGVALEEWPELVYMGQDIGAYGGVFKATEGYTEKFGEDRVRNTPLCESAIVGSALGYAISGGKAMMEMQFSDFVSTGFNQIVNNLAKLHWRWGQAVDVVIRMPTGAGVAAGPFHSQSTEAWFTHTPGLKVVYPAFPSEAKALLLASFADPNPVMFFEHKALYRTLKEEVPQGKVSTTLGTGTVVTQGDALSIITYGMGVHWALEALEAMGLEGQVEIFNMRTLVPLDIEGIKQSVCKTGKVIVLQEDVAVGGYGEHVVSLLSKECWDQLDGPITLVASDATPVPFHETLEESFLAKSKLQAAIEDLMQY